MFFFDQFPIFLINFQIFAHFQFVCPVFFHFPPHCLPIFLPFCSNLDFCENSVFLARILMDFFARILKPRILMAFPAQIFKTKDFKGRFRSDFKTWDFEWTVSPNFKILDVNDLFRSHGI